jgi:hypothetical protein
VARTGARFGTDEKMAWTGEFLGHSAGKLEVSTAGGCKDQRRVVDVRAVAYMDRPPQRVGEIDTRLDAATGLPSSDVIDVNAGPYRWRTTHVFDGGEVYAASQSGDRDGFVRHCLPSSERALDANAFLQLLRAWQPNPAEHTSAIVVLGEYAWRVDLTYRGLDTVAVQGEPRTLRLVGGVATPVGTATVLSCARAISIPAKTGQSATKFRIWLSDDPARIPLKAAVDMEIGDVVISLLSHQTFPTAECTR